MPKVKMNVPRIGPAGSVQVGEVIEVDADEAKRMIEKGQCELVRGKTAEKAVK